MNSLLPNSACLCTGAVWTFALREQDFFSYPTNLLLENVQYLQRIVVELYMVYQVIRQKIIDIVQTKKLGTNLQ